MTQYCSTFLKSNGVDNIYCLGFFWQLIRKRSAAIEKVKRYLAVTIKEHEETFDPDNVRDFIDLYIKASRDKTDPEIYTG